MTTNCKFLSSRLGIVETCTAKVNLTKIDRWTAELGLNTLWLECQR